MESVDDAGERRQAIGRRVARWRGRRGLTRQQFADLCGRSLSWVDKVESGERGLLRLPMLERVAEVLHVTVESLTDLAEARQARHCLDVFEISSIRAALQSYHAISRVFLSPSAAAGEPPDLDRLSKQCTYAWTAFQNAHWPSLGHLLPQLLTTAQTAVAAYPGTDDEARRARTLSSQVYQVTASTLWKLKEVDLAWLAAERALVLAEGIGDSLLISDAARRVAQGLMVMSYHDQALELLRTDIDRLEPERGVGSSMHLSLYGMLFLMGAVVAARASRQALALDLLAEGESVARQLGHDENDCFTAFGPTNVNLHRVAVLLELGDGTGAVGAARQVAPDGLARLPKERRATYYLDVAWGHSLAGHQDEAASTVLAAEGLFPDEIRCRPMALDLVGVLRRCPSRAHVKEIEQLAVRIGLADD